MKILVKIIFAVLSALGIILGTIALILAIAATSLPALSFPSVVLTLVSATLSAAALISSCLLVGNKFIRITFFVTLIGLILSIAVAFIVFI